MGETSIYEPPKLCKLNIPRESIFGVPDIDRNHHIRYLSRKNASEVVESFFVQGRCRSVMGRGCFDGSDIIGNA